MKKFFLLALLTLINCQIKAQHCNAIVGKWLNKRGEGQVEIYQYGNKYLGKLVWLKHPNDAHGKPLTDQRNIRPALRGRPLLGTLIMRDLTCDGISYTGGSIYDPRRGKTFGCELTMKGNTLKVEAMMGMFPVGSETWTRVKD
ncbi:DUF2147 domain-containing protein [Mucilaginibacter gossypiicola]|nr:DUF2147 domain-containing protein [Mucilaginibacter gossypiicola]